MNQDLIKLPGDSFIILRNNKYYLYNGVSDEIVAAFDYIFPESSYEIGFLSFGIITEGIFEDVSIKKMLCGELFINNSFYKLYNTLELRDGVFERIDSDLFNSRYNGTCIKYFETKEGSIRSQIKGVYSEAEEYLNGLAKSKFQKNDNYPIMNGKTCYQWGVRK